MSTFEKLTPLLVKKDQPETLDKRLETFNNPKFCCVIGEQLLQEGRPDAALGFFQKAVELDSNSTHGWFGRGMAYTNMEEYAESCKYFRTVLKLDPKLAIAHHNLGRSLHETGQADLAFQSYQKSVNLGFVPSSKDLAISVPGCPSASNRTILLERRKCADEVQKSTGIGREEKSVKRDRNKKRLKIGYVSAFFHRDNWMKPVWGLVGQHDREKIQVCLFADRTKLSPAIKKMLKPGDQFYNLSDLSNEEAADLISSQQVDILVDLNGYSYPKRFPVFLYRPAPLVVGWFNMYATTGFECFDYLIGDDCVIPQNEETYYTEKIARVAGSYLTFSVGYNVPDVSEPPCIANEFITFGSLISQYKITEKVIDTWSEILKASPNSRLLIRNAFLGKNSNQTFLRTQFEKSGIAGERISLEGPAAHYEFLETYSRIDIALDAFPYNGGTTTTEAIWQGVPVVSYWGDRWVSRTSATLLRSAGLADMVAESLQDYIRLATHLAGNFELLKTMRLNMRDNLLRSDACDTTAFARSMERLYREIWEYQN
jgi:protein O-GlcNAc transferase